MSYSTRSKGNIIIDQGDDIIDEIDDELHNIECVSSSSDEDILSSDEEHQQSIEYEEDVKSWEGTINKHMAQETNEHDEDDHEKYPNYSDKLDTQYIFDDGLVELDFSSSDEEEKQQQQERADYRQHMRNKRKRNRVILSQITNTDDNENNNNNVLINNHDRPIRKKQRINNILINQRNEHQAALFHKIKQTTMQKSCSLIPYEQHQDLVQLNPLNILSSSHQSHGVAFVNDHPSNYLSNIPEYLHRSLPDKFEIAQQMDFGQAYALIDDHASQTIKQIKELLNYQWSSLKRKFILMQKLQRDHAELSSSLNMLSEPTLSDPFLPTLEKALAFSKKVENEIKRLKRLPTASIEIIHH